MRDTVPVLALRADIGFALPWRALFRRGVGVHVRVGCGVRETMRDSLGLDPAYIDERVRSIFLDGSPLDDIDTPKIAAGSTLSLGGGMPGLVGITLNRASPLCHFRGDIGWKGGKECGTGQGEITLKLFNLVAEDLVPLLLARGVLVEATDAAAIMHEAALDWRSGHACPVKAANLDGQAIDPAELASALEKQRGRLLVRVEWEL